MTIHSFHRSFAAEPSLIHSVFDLLETSFPGIGRAKIKSEHLGVLWETGSTPFVLFKDSKAVCHAGVLEIPICFRGKPVKVAGIHAVCTRPEYRRRGLFRQVMQEAIAFVDQRFENSVLFTAQPELYTPFGFRVIQEYVFKTQCEQKPRTKGLRMLNFQDPADVSLLHRLLENRKPISNSFGIGPEKGIFCFDEGSRPPFYLTSRANSQEVLISLEIEGNRLHLFDIIGPKICSLSELLENIDQPIQEAWIYFSPDQLGVEAQAEPIMFEGDSILMARGPLAFESIQFMWPRSGRC